MRRDNPRELWLSFIAVIIITFAYLFMLSYLNEVPRASDFFGHTIGVAGFILMLMTETVYSLRKRSRSARWGRMSTWLDFHIFTGLVGPYMVLLHTSWKFNGLAGIVMLLTVVIVASGFIGRYIYTAVPRTVDGVELEAAELARQIELLDTELGAWLAGRAPELQAAIRRVAQPASRNRTSFSSLVARPFYEWRARSQIRAVFRRLDRNTQGQYKNLERLLRRRRRLQRQTDTLATARRMMALWHAVHIPIGMALFTAAFIHIGAAIYYATLLH